MKHMLRVLRAEDGQDLAEYAILVSLIALVVIAALTLFGGRIQALFEAVTAAL